MKKIYLIILFFILIISIIIYPKLISKSNNDFHKSKLEKIFNSEEINYILTHQIDFDNLEIYLQYKYFNLLNYFDYETLRTSNNYTHLEAINIFRYPNYHTPYLNSKEAILTNSSLALINKSFYLKEDYIPNNLVSVLDYNIDYVNSDIVLKKEVLDSYQEMYSTALTEGIEFTIFSGFRSYRRQEYLFYQIYNDDSISAKPGHSEHQSGYAVDISTRDIGLINEFENSKVYVWLIKNSANYGFILRFPKDKQDITKYQFEPWHFRYVGKIATLIMSENLTLEEYIFSNLEI